MKNKNIFWGLAFIILAVAIGLDAFGYFGNIGIFKIISAVLLAIIIIQSVFHVHFWGIFIPLAFIGILFKTELGIANLTPWPILGIAILFSIGFSLIFKKSHFNCCISHNHHYTDRIINDDPSCDCSVSFSSIVKYINSDNFECSKIDCSFGSASIYFDKAHIQGDSAQIIVDVSFGSVELFVPKNWNIIKSADSSFGGIEEKNNNAVKDGPTVYLEGDISFSGVTIYYI
ncbi:MAG: hypothetical protein SPJ62_08590 [Inconstantimicrobium porci]|uniref:LiaF transmembrane domain-containing protein n=2 Tax=Inconstantimicrobium porci TaxID=2652291 RepID=A0A7X2MZF8_9CLOT|nr:hypothetical protein [Inconstantimicrobium porci]MDY5912044.1 hypothetical protein [Inconstantimicrobium porci]MSR91916.1 hypothetical protein [Inconstantimicrobium porci]